MQSRFKGFEFQPEDFTKASAEEQENLKEKLSPGSYWKDAWRKLRGNVVAMCACILLLLITIFALLGPICVPYHDAEQLRGAEGLGPMQYSASEINKMNAGEAVFPHIFGTDTHGRDLFVRTMQATRISVLIGVFAAMIVCIIGTLYGSVSGYLGGKVDFIMMRIVDIIYSLPDILVVLLLSSIIKAPLQNFINDSKNKFFSLIGGFGVGIISIFIVFALLFWVGTARIIRGQVLMLKSQEFVTAAKALGASSGRIIRKHIIPNCIGQIIVITMMQIPSAIFLESFLSFLGLGVSAPHATLGSLIADSLSGMRMYPSRLLIPSVILSVIILCFNLFGDGLRDALDPRMKRESG
jgi:oligopeptide transport system permease protein